MTLRKIRVLIVDDFADTRDSIAKLLYFEKDIEVAGAAGDGQQGIDMARQLRPDVILMDINMPGMDGIATTEIISSTMPECQVIMMSVQGEADYLRRSMLAGAREYLVKPFTGDELAASIRHVHELGAEKRARYAVAATQPLVAQAATETNGHHLGRILSVFGPKGGVGKTTVAVNLAIALRTMLDKRVALVDGCLLFGDVGIMLNLNTGKSIADLAPNLHLLDLDLLNRVMVEHSSGVRVLLAPPRPELAELMTADHLRTILGLLEQNYDYVVVDTHASFEDTTLGVLDLSRHILVVTTLEMPAIKNLKIFLEVTEALQYPHEKLLLILNRSDSTGGIKVEDIEQNIRFKVASSIVSAGQLMTAAVNQGNPVVVSNRDSAVSRSFFDLARLVMTEEDAEEAIKRGFDPSCAGREARSGIGIGRLRLPSFSGGSKKGGN